MATSNTGAERNTKSQKTITKTIGIHSTTHTKTKQNKTPEYNQIRQNSPTHNI